MNKKGRIENINVEINELEKCMDNLAFFLAKDTCEINLLKKRCADGAKKYMELDVKVVNLKEKRERLVES